MTTRLPTFEKEAIRHNVRRDGKRCERVHTISKIVTVRPIHANSASQITMNFSKRDCLSAVPSYFKPS